MANTTNTLNCSFSVQKIVETCDTWFSDLLNQTASIKRPYDNEHQPPNVNDYGEIVYPADNSGEAPTVASVSTRISSKKGEGLEMEYFGKKVIANWRAFFCPSVDVRVNDRLEVGNKKYLVMRINEAYRESKLHHLEAFCQELTNL